MDRLTENYRRVLNGIEQAAAAAGRDPRTVRLLAVSKTFPIKPGTRYVVNVGSVGYPRCDFCSTYVIYDTESQRLTFRRLPIDIPAYAEKLEAHGIRLPFWLADALSSPRL